MYGTPPGTRAQAVGAVLGVDTRAELFAGDVEQADVGAFRRGTAGARHDVSGGAVALVDVQITLLRGGRARADFHLDDPRAAQVRATGLRGQHPAVGAYRDGFQAVVGPVELPVG